MSREQLLALEYRRISKRCACGAVTTPSWDDETVPVEHAQTVAAPGSPVRIGPETVARAALLTCAHYLPIVRSRDLLVALTGIDVSTGFLAGIRGRAARRLEKRFLPHAGHDELHSQENQWDCHAPAGASPPVRIRWFGLHAYGRFVTASMSSYSPKKTTVSCGHSRAAFATSILPSIVSSHFGAIVMYYPRELKPMERLNSAPVLSVTE
jgi:hypothetical protein